jgi:hypothetical protein
MARGVKTMARIRVTTDEFGGPKIHTEFEARRGSDNWVVSEGEYRQAVFFDDEVRVLGKHEGDYDPEHWGEQDPDSYDRLGYQLGAGKHLLETGVN